ncbi:MAG: hypothetical protein QOJ07_1902 [Thermoleophilaceae bacterium]|nr:hypothetical protein [Thermoleophilaceae bacterium]
MTAAAADLELLERHRPLLAYDSQGILQAVSARAMAENPGNRLVSGGVVIATAGGSPPLTLETLAAYPPGDHDRLLQAEETIPHALRLQADPSYGNRVHGRVVHGDDRVWLQYWAFFYSTPNMTGLTPGRADWKLAQIALEGGDPVRLTLTGDGGAEAVEWDKVGHPGGDALRPIVFVSPFSNGLYADAGAQEGRGPWHDAADGRGVPLEPAVELLPAEGWPFWPGRWGTHPTTARGLLFGDAPLSPARRREWSEPERYERGSGRGWAASPLVRGLSRARHPDPPEIDARIEAGRVVIHYNLADGGGSRLLWVSLHDGPAFVERRIVTAEKTGQLVINPPRQIARWIVRASVYDLARRRSDVVEHVISEDDPTKAEQSLLDAVLAEEIDAAEIREFHGDPGLSPTELDAKFRADEATAADTWRAVAVERREFRETAGRVVEIDALETGARLRTALSGPAVWLGAVAVAAILLILILVFSLPYEATVLAPAIALAYSGVSVVRRRAAAREMLPPSSQRDGIRRAADQQRRTLVESLRDKGVRPALREIVNAGQQLPYGKKLRFSAKGLAEVRVREHEIPTRTSKRLDALATSLKSGSIGVAGPRGAGKTTLIRHFCERKEEEGWLTVFASAPVEYDARDFVLTLFATACERVKATRPAGGVRIPSSTVAAPRRPRQLGRDFLASLIPVAAAAIGSLAVVALLTEKGDPRRYAVPAAGLAAIAAVAAGVRRFQADRAREQTDEERLQAEAEANAGEIRFQQSWSYGYSGKFKLPAAGEAGVETTTSFAQKQRSFPEILDAFRDFLRLAVKARGGVVIGIDEMDKIASAESAHRFLNEIKGIFGVEGCFFLVSISENAMSSFERRGLPFRDAFDSSFDEVLPAHPLTAAESARLLRRRVLKLSAPFIDLCHVMSGGLARDLIRVTRQLDHMQVPKPAAPPVLADVTADLIRAELERKVEAAAVCARAVRFEPETGQLIMWMRRLAEGSADVEDVLEHSTSMPPPPRPDRAEADAAAREDLDWLRVELAGFSYYLVTVLQFFKRLDGPDRIRAAEEAGAFEALARARQRFEVNPRVAWDAVDAFRDAQDPKLPLYVLPGSGAPTGVALAPDPATNGHREASADGPFPRFRRTAGGMAHRVLGF